MALVEAVVKKGVWLCPHGPLFSGEGNNATVFVSTSANKVWKSVNGPLKPWHIFAKFFEQLKKMGRPLINQYFFCMVILILD